jgi:hypothetical protein
VLTTGPVERRLRSLYLVRVVRETGERIIERSPSPPLEGVRTTRIIERERRSPSSPPPERLRARVIETRESVREHTPSPPPVCVNEVYREQIQEPSRELSQERIRVRNIEWESVRAPPPSPSPSPSPPTDPAQSGSQTQSLVLYGTYLPQRNTPTASISSRNSTSTRSTRSLGNFGAYWYFGFPYTDALKTLEFATDEDIKSDQEARRNLINRGLPLV